MAKRNDGHQLNLKGKKAEEFVHELAKKSFLEDWCYCNPKLPNGKEICDLLIIYDEIAIIWQIKDIKLNDNGKYKKSEIDKNLRQINGAKRSLFELKIPIELENPRRGKELFNPKQIKTVYLISALLGDGEDFFSFVENINNHIIHTFTRIFTEIVLGELDTIKDFINYLEEKEDLITADNEIIISGGEEELLAYYLMNEHNFEKIKKVNMIIIEDDLWEDYINRPECIAKKKEDEISYGWDEIINRAHTCGGEYELIARELARPSRFERRCLGKAFYEAHVIAHNQKEKNTFRRVIKIGDATYCFLFMDDIEPRKNRKLLLSSICYVARGLYQNNTKVIGIATEMKSHRQCSYDFSLLEIPNWTEVNQIEMDRLQKKAGILTDVQTKNIHEDEYPLIRPS